MNKEHNVEIDLKKVHEVIDFGKAIERLEANPDYQLVIQEEYLKNEIIRLAHMKGDAMMFTGNADIAKASKEHNEFLLNGIAAFSSFIRHRKNIAETFKKELQDYQTEQEFIDDENQIEG